ncbi:MAG: hypothetical protein AAF735_07805 [Myxococcota bacterium]
MLRKIVTTKSYPSFFEAPTSLIIAVGHNGKLGKNRLLALWIDQELGPQALSRIDFNEESVDRTLMSKLRQTFKSRAEYSGLYLLKP